MRLFEADLEVEGLVRTTELAEECDGSVGFFVGRSNWQDALVAKFVGRAAVDQVLHADERCRVARGSQHLRRVRRLRRKSPAERRMRQPEHASRMRVHARVQGGTTGTALRGRAK